jgi:hypothetical protein
MATNQSNSMAIRVTFFVSFVGGRNVNTFLNIKLDENNTAGSGGNGNFLQPPSINVTNSAGNINSNTQSGQSSSWQHLSHSSHSYVTPKMPIFDR